MMKNILKNKKILALIIAFIVIVVGVLVVALGGHGTKEEEKSDTNIETEKKNETEALEDEMDALEEADDPGFKDSGLDISSGEADSIDGSGNWDEKDSVKEEEKEESNQNKDKTNDKKDKEDTPKDDVKDESSGNMSNQDVLVDDREWGDID